MSLYIGTNYHPHDWTRERWGEDIQLMKAAGLDTVRMGHLAWDSFEPQDGIYTFEWFDEVMDLFHLAGIKAVLDISLRPRVASFYRTDMSCFFEENAALIKHNGKDRELLHVVSDDYDMMLDVDYYEGGKNSGTKINGRKQGIRLN